MAKKVSAFKAAHIEVNCKKNDPVDIKCGGPQYLGFDFYVDPKKVKELTEVIRQELQDNFPDLRIYNSGKRLVKKLWTKEMIIKSIRKDAPNM